MDIFTLIFLAISIVLAVISLIKNKKKTFIAMKKSKKMMGNMLGQIVAIIFLIGLVLTLIPPEAIKKYMGESNTLISTIVGAIAGSITLIPAFVAFPLVGSLVDSGASIVPAVAFLTTLTMVGIMTFPLEKKEFGTKFAVTRNVLSFAFAVMIALVMGGNSMKILTFAKKNRLLFFVAFAYVIVLILSPDKFIESLKNSSYYLLEMVQVLPIIFLLTVVIDAWVPKEIITKGIGEKSKIKGNLISLVIGSISAGPIYAAFPIAKTLFSKGASITNIIIIISAWAVVKVPMLANEVKFLGFDFMAVRWMLTVLSIVTMSYLAALVIKRKDISRDDNDGKFIIKNEYCIGCAICTNMQPEFFEISDNKATIINTPKDSNEEKSIREVVKKCPANAVVFLSDTVSNKK